MRRQSLCMPYRLICEPAIDCSMADPELTKAFAEHQAKVIETVQQVKIARSQIDVLKMTAAKAELTDKEISALPDGTRTYESVGRMFLLQPLGEVRKHLHQKKDAALEKIKSIETNVEYLEKNLKCSEDSVRELVSQKRKEL